MRHILLVEDNPNDAELAMIGFQKNRLKNPIVHVKNGVEALDYLFGRGDYSTRDIGDLPQLILLDLKLPKLHGLEVLDQIRADERTRHVPVVVLTSSSQDDDVVQSYSKGANAYVRKPIDFQEFIKAVSHLGLFWLLLNESPRLMLEAGALVEVPQSTPQN